ncbi:hypothetical protein PGT21_031014 [Puccinia graminis f. sp. tritici]|uniref:Uncharacterized protein n=1 Tax=Puccinia graminis f. sp. tritici TaxID=56615 RepID=A0A5B0R3R5_PUCGR|nr:hypothetical protein PGT21_031014 [Puccinia graminis f. sp. tritici]
MIEIESCVFVPEEPPVPRGDAINAPSWFIFRGRGIATYSEANILVHCNSGHYVSNFTPRHRNLPYPIVRGYLKVIDQGLKCLALDPDTHDSAIFRFTSQSPVW